MIVIQPSAEGRKASGRPVWLGLVNDVDAARDIRAWVKAGGPGIIDSPAVLDLYTFSPSRRIRQALEGLNTRGSAAPIGGHPRTAQRSTDTPCRHH